MKSNKAFVATEGAARRLALTEHWSIEARVFLNTMFGEVMTQVCHKKIGHLDCDCRLVKVLTPLVLLYSSLELRSTIKRLLRDKFFD